MIYDLTTAKLLPVPFAAHKLFGDKQLEFVHCVLKPQENIPLHDNPVDVWFYILAGQGQLQYGLEKVRMKAHQLIKVEKSLLRSWENLSSTNDFVFLVVKHQGSAHTESA